MFQWQCCCATDNDDRPPDLPYGAEDLAVLSVVPHGALDSTTEQEPEQREPKQWIVTLEKGGEGGRFGFEVDIDTQKGLAVLKEPSVGAAGVWNQSAKTNGFRVGDIVEAVNGVTGEAKKLIAVLKEADTVQLNMKRLVDYTITLDVEHGLGLRFKDSKGVAAVERILKSGDVNLYNNTCLAGYRVAPGNWLISVNGRSGAPKDVIRMASDLRSGKVRLRFGRASPTQAGLRDQVDGDHSQVPTVAPKQERELADQI